MTTEAVPSRRSFLKGGVMLAPFVAAPAAALAPDDSRSRLTRLEAEMAARSLHADLLRRINTGDRIGAAALFADPRSARIDANWITVAAAADAEPDAIDVSADGRRACGRHVCMVETISAMALDSTFAQMAYAQGGGHVRQTERKVMIVDYVRNEAGWAIGQVQLTSA